MGDRPKHELGKEHKMGQLLLQKARTQRLEALWAKRVGARLRAEVAGDLSTHAAPLSTDDARNRVKVFSAHA